MEIRTLPPIPQYFQLSNQSIQEVGVTIHAWNQFVTRYTAHILQEPNFRPGEFYANQMRCSFMRADKHKLGRAHAVRRILTNRYVPALYYLDRAVDMRFVVVAENQPMLITVEIPWELVGSNCHQSYFPGRSRSRYKRLSKSRNSYSTDLNSLSRRESKEEERRWSELARCLEMSKIKGREN